MRMIAHNYTTQPETTITATSEKSLFPSSNLGHEFRSKTWRSSGNFTVDATNNKINFEEAADTELTATLISGSYSTSELAVEIKSQLESIGVNTYGVSWSAVTGKWTISSSGEHFSLLNDTGSDAEVGLLTASLGFAVSDYSGSLTYTGAHIAIHTEEAVIFDFKTTEEVNSCALLWPKMDGIRLSSSATLKLQANATNEWSAPAVDVSLDVDNDYSLATHFFDESQSFRYWRIVLRDSANANLWVDLGVVVLGQSADLISADNGFSYQLTDNSTVSSNRFGNQYVDEYPQLAQIAISYGLLDYEQDVLTLDSIFRTNGNRVPVLVVLDHEGLALNKNHMIVYGKFDSRFSLKRLHYDMFSSSLVITEIA